MFKAPTWKSPLISAGISAALFLLLCSNTLDSPGLYYDEVHQAPASFMYLGRKPYTFAPLVWRSIPLLTMPYSGAVKPALYGLWMKTSGLHFTVVGWRFFGVALVAIGLFVFCILATRTLRVLGLTVFLFLFLTDVSVLLTSRHDWGPTAVALMLRLIWLGVWIHEESADLSSTIGLILLGFIPAFSIYEKLNNVVLGGPLVIVLLSGKARVARRTAIVSFGFLLGLIPLAVVNLLSGGISYRAFLGSVASAGSGHVRVEEILSFLKGFFSLGDGHIVSTYVLGVEPIPWMPILELTLLTGLLGISVILAVRFGRQDTYGRLTGIGLMFYLSIVVLFVGLLLRTSSAHHWLAGTPFQYVALGMAAELLRRRVLASRRWLTAAPATVLLILLVLSRSYGVAAMEKNLADRRHSVPWDPSLTTAAAFAVAHQADASFIAADWGFATQIYALSNGTFPVAEPFWSWGERWRAEELVQYVAQRPSRPVYVLSMRAPTVSPVATAAIVKTVDRLAGGRQLPLEDELANLALVRVLKFPAIDLASLNACTSPPPAPGDLRVVTNSGGTVTLSWNETRAARTLYTVEAGRAPGLADVANLEVGWTTMFTATQVKPATYYVRIRGRNDCGKGDASAELIVSVP